MRLLVTGAQSEAAAAALEAALREDEPDVPVTPTAPEAAPDVARRVVDPMMIAEAALGVGTTSLILQVPSAILAAGDLAERMRKRRRAHAITEAARRLRAEFAAGIYVVGPDGALLALDQLSEDALLEPAARS